jgi:hypothetical protein
MHKSIYQIKTNLTIEHEISQMILKQRRNCSVKLNQTDHQLQQIKQSDQLVITSLKNYQI